MAKDTSTMNASPEGKTKKITRAEFMVAMDEINATLQGQMAEMHASRERTKALRAKADQLAAETREILLNSDVGKTSFDWVNSTSNQQRFGGK